jgi:hypothetical protein
MICSSDIWRHFLVHYVGIECGSILSSICEMPTFSTSKIAGRDEYAHDLACIDKRRVENIRGATTPEVRGR